jgi:hypothetical protein
MKLISKKSGIVFIIVIILGIAIYGLSVNFPNTFNSRRYNFMKYSSIALLFVSLCFSCFAQANDEESYESILLQIREK